MRLQGAALQASLARCLAAGSRCCGCVHLASWTIKGSSPGEISPALGSPLALVEQDPGTNAIRVKRSHTLTVGGRAGSSWPGPFWQLNGGCGKSKAMPTTDGFNSCGTFQQVSHPGVTPLHMRGSEGYLEK